MKATLLDASLQKLPWKTIGIVLLVALQFVSAGYFVVAAVADHFDMTRVLAGLEQREYREIIRAMGLSLGVVLGWMVLRQTFLRAQRAEKKLRAASQAFMVHLDQQLTAWALTPAERDVALFAIKGLSIRDIAQLRGTSEGTVKAQCNAIYTKAGVSGRSQLLSVFIEDLMAG